MLNIEEKKLLEIWCSETPLSLHEGWKLLDALAREFIATKPSQTPTIRQRYKMAWLKSGRKSLSVLDGCASASEFADAMLAEDAVHEARAAVEKS